MRLEIFTRPDLIRPPYTIGRLDDDDAAPVTLEETAAGARLLAVRGRSVRPADVGLWDALERCGLKVWGGAWQAKAERAMGVRARAVSNWRRADQIPPVPLVIWLAYLATCRRACAIGSYIAEGDNMESAAADDIAIARQALEDLR